ncbi:MAG: heme o synthase [Chloroflexota bacterium]
MSRLFRLAALAALSTFASIVLAGLARVRTGPGCAGWPRCDGRWLPPADPALLVDWLHRAVSASIGAVLLATAIAATLTAAASARTRRAAWAAVALVAAQSALGAFTAGSGTLPWIGTVHLGLAMAVFAASLLTVLCASADRGAPAWLAAAGGGEADPRLRRAGLIGAAATFVLILSGAASNAAGAALACAWPLCPDGAPAAARAASVSAAGFQASTLAAAALAVVIGWQAWRGSAAPAARWLAAASVGLVALQAALGGAAMTTHHPAWLGPAVLATMTPLLAVMLAFVFVPAPGLAAAGAGAGAGAGSGVVGGGAAMPRAGRAWALAAPGEGVAGTVRDYVALTKPGIMSLLLTTELGAMAIAQAGAPPFSLVVWALLGGVLSAGGANALNCYIDRDIDAKMTRTRDRASAAGRIAPERVLAFGVALTAISVVLLWVAVNPLAAMLALAGNLFYVFIYTLWLKRRTPQNIVIGGAAGAFPPLVGWAAVTGDLPVLAWGLFWIIFLWTPPHFWSLALLKQGEYGRVGVPMLPNVKGEAETRKQILIYTVLLFALCVALTPFGLGWIYLAAAIVINGVFLAYAARLYLNPSKATARGMFLYSLWYLALIYGAAVIDRIVTR